MSLDDLLEFAALARARGVTVEAVDPFDRWVTARAGETVVTLSPLGWRFVRGNLSDPPVTLPSDPPARAVSC